jgi:hypothetical protein
MSSQGSEDAAASFDAEPDADRPNRCRESIGNGLIRQYLFRVKAGSDTPDDLRMGEHIASCEACQEIVEELNCFEEALRFDYRQLAPLLTADLRAGEDEEAPDEAPGPEIGELHEWLTNKLVSVIELSRRIDKLDREYEIAFQSPEGLRLFQASCKAEFNRIDSDQSSELQEFMIDMWRTGQGGTGTTQRLCDIPVARKYPFEFLLGISSSKSVVEAKQRRRWYRDPDPDPKNPLPFVVETETKSQVAAA